MAQRRTRRLRAGVSPAFVETSRILAQQEENQEGQGLADPRYGDPGDAVAGGASTDTGWGVVAGWSIYHGK